MSWKNESARPRRYARECSRSVYWSVLCPRQLCNTEEVVEIAKVMGALGGFHELHMRDETDQVEEPVRETIRIGEEGSLPT